MDSKKETKMTRICMGDHLCCIYKNKDEQFSILVPYFIEGLRKNEKCFYICDENTQEYIIEEFTNRGLFLQKYINSGQFVIGDKTQVYLIDGEFNPEKTIDLIKTVEAQALKEGYSGVRATGEMSWALKNEVTIKQVIEYEAKLNEIFDYLKFVTICLYDETKFDQKLLLEAIHTHPLVIINEKVAQNKYYFDPFLFNSEHLPLPEDAYEFIKKDLFDEN